jgi:hypothetical protein
MNVSSENGGIPDGVIADGLRNKLSRRQSSIGKIYSSGAT